MSSDDLARHAAHLPEPDTCPACKVIGTVHVQQVCDRHGIRELDGSAPGASTC